MRADARRQAEMDRREAERDQREAERDRLAREADQTAYKANRENRVTLLQVVRVQRASFDDRGAAEDDFPDAYIKYLSGLSTGTSLSDDEKIIVKARELYKEYEPKQGTGHYTGCWSDRLATTCKQTGRYQHATKEKIDLFISENWFKEKDKNSIIFKKYVNMAKEIEQKKAKKEIEQKRLFQYQQKKKEDEEEEEEEDDEDI
jgi:hypothetical protein